MFFFIYVFSLFLNCTWMIVNYVICIFLGNIF
ncbi:hypothetical protein Leryth_018518 [Lithospermum erythrorhizon]|nr:hypothetical protein Leryth_018518 [Lithospermum erythrorhizon]